MLSLAASDVHCAPDREVRPPQNLRHKTNFYNMLEAAGQTDGHPLELPHLLAKHPEGSQHLIAGIPTRARVVCPRSLLLGVVVVPNVVRILKFHLGT